MALQLHQRYSIEEIYKAFGGVDEAEIFCGGDFIVFPKAIICCVILPHQKNRSHFSSVAEFVWAPQHFDYAPKEAFPWFPEAVREVRNTERSQGKKQHHLFVKASTDEHYFYVGPVSLLTYGQSWYGASAHFLVQTILPRQAWLHFGGSLSPRQPFASLPNSEAHRSNIKFHRKTLSLLHIMPPMSKAAVSRLDQFEQRTSIHIPASIREWYSLMGCMEIMREISFMHKPAYITDYDEKFSDRYMATPPHLPMLPIMYQNQGVWHIAAVLDSADEDPPVYLGFQGDETFEWHLHAHHFSDFVYSWAWEYVAYERDYIINVSGYMTDADMAYLRETFQLHVTTFRGVGYYVCDRNERYADGEQRITVMVCSDASDIVWFSAETVESLQALLGRSWSFAGKPDQYSHIDMEMRKGFLYPLDLYL